jgi:DNA-binding response OmpR family regulator
MSTIKILYAEDDEALAYLTKDNLEQSSYEVRHCADGRTCYESFKNEHFDLCIFDIMLPKMDGFELTTEIRKLNPDVPILFLSSKVLKEDRIKGLKLGADDYLVKPFSIEELLLKIEIFLTRSKKNDHSSRSVYTLGNYQFHVSEHILLRDKEKINLTQRETQLLKLFLDHKDKVLKREEILKKLWGDDDYFLGRSLDVFISRLRKILTKENGILIENIHGVGFKFSMNPAKSE